MPILDVEDAVEVRERIDEFFREQPDRRADVLRRLFVEVLDFDRVTGSLDLGDPGTGVQLPDHAERIAQLDGVHVLYAPLNTRRINKREAAAFAQIVERDLGPDMLLLLDNEAADQLHVIHPQVGARPTLRRLIFERDGHNRTSLGQTANLYQHYQRTGDLLGALKDAFDVEPVTKEFFKQYKALFERAEGVITGFADTEERKQFVQTLFNRLMFVYFLSRKGWLRYDGNTDYLNALWDAYDDHPDHDNFYNHRLTFLFFQGLNNPDSRDVRGGLDFLIGDVPFLNGGLFEETDLDQRPGIHVPDHAIRPLMTELFDRFNFTVMESTPFDIEVAVDPEMLGKVFEELITARHDSGAYYTPRPVVSFMCREALKGYLESHLPVPDSFGDPLGSGPPAPVPDSFRDPLGSPPARKGADPRTSRGMGDGSAQDPAKGVAAANDPIAQFIDHHDASGLSLADARAISQALDEVTVVDPACGSGAYLVGMMQELVELQTALYSEQLKQDARSLYQLKLHIIERNLYGVDLDPFAVNIAMLRLWLSLAIEYEHDQPEPLPNLDFKILEGDSLLGPDPSEVNQSAYLISQTDLAKLKAAYMRETDPSAKARLREQIADRQTQLREAMGDVVAEEALDWRVEFAEIFAKGGFNVVLANPPYVVVKGDVLRSLYRSSVYGRMNTYGLFLHRCLQTIADGGQLVFINPRTLLTDRYFRNLRIHIKQRSEVRGVVLIEDRHNTFDRVLQECIIFHAAKRHTPAKQYVLHTRSISLPEELNDPLTAFAVDSKRALLGDAYDGAIYIGPSELDYAVFERMDREGVRLESLGIHAETGKIQFDKYKEYARPSPQGAAYPLLWAENIQRYAQRGPQKRVGRQWLSSAIVEEVAPSIDGPSILTQRTTASEQPRRIIATLVTSLRGDSQVGYSENGTNLIPLGLNDPRQSSYILAALNSSVMEFIFRHLNSNVHVSAGEINSLPFPKAPKTPILQEIHELVTDLLTLGGVDAAKEDLPQAINLEQRLDLLIGNLYALSHAEVHEVARRLSSYNHVYGLTDEEIAAVEARVSS